MIFKTIIIYLTLKINFVLANSADQDEMPHFAAFHQGLHYLSKHLCMGIQITLCLLVLSADNFCKQFGPRSGPT